MLLASLTRERVAILQQGYIEHPSDVAGIIYIPFNNHVKEAVPKLSAASMQSASTWTRRKLRRHQRRGPHRLSPATVTWRMVLGCFPVE